MGPILSMLVNGSSQQQDEVDSFYYVILAGCITLLCALFGRANFGKSWQLPIAEPKNQSWTRTVGETFARLPTSRLVCLIDATATTTQTVACKLLLQTGFFFFFPLLLLPCCWRCNNLHATGFHLLASVVVTATESQLINTKLKELAASVFAGWERARARSQL